MRESLVELDMSLAFTRETITRVGLDARESGIDCNIAKVNDWVSTRVSTESRHHRIYERGKKIENSPMIGPAALLPPLSLARLDFFAESTMVDKRSQYTVLLNVHAGKRSRFR
jgi:hypothetical protein